MLLNSLQFAFFFLIFLAVLFVLPKKLRKLWLFAADCVFYLSWERSAFILLLLSSLMIWLCGLALDGSGKPDEASAGGRSKKRIIFLVIPVLWNFGLLVVFRSTGLLSGILSRFHVSLPFTFADLLAPLGVSFYTLRCISYMAEVWRGTVRAVRNPLDVFIYVSFFPQIISGPIERPGKFFAGLEAFTDKRLWDPERIFGGFLLTVWGLFQKIVLAERLSVIASPVFNNYSAFGFWDYLIGSAAYALQLYCDFGGYSDMSRGIAGMMGFSAPRNFLRPYLTRGMKDFWRRWHVSLTSWYMDYIYIPLGGNRRGLLRKYINLTIVFLFSGFWHGNTLNYLFWGLLMSFYLIMEDLWNRTGKKLPAWLMWFIMAADMTFSWFFFNGDGLNRSFRMIRHIFTHYPAPTVLENTLAFGNFIVLGCGLLILAFVDILHERKCSVWKKFSALPLPVRWLILLGLFWSVIMLGIYGETYSTSNFIYARF